jgi:glutaredoxin/glutathione-dependent peroxiredoxin
MLTMSLSSTVRTTVLKGRAGISSNYGSVVKSSSSSQQQQLCRRHCRYISIGTDMRSSIISLQKSRPWYNNDTEGSNNAIDNTVYLNDLFSPTRTVVMFGVPAPFTGVCTNAHYPPYKQLADTIKGSGVDEIVCYSVSDPYSMHGWATNVLNNDPNKISFLCDPEATFAKAYGIDTIYNAVSLGQRSIRFSMIVQNGIVIAYNVVDDAATDAATILTELQEL